MVKCCEKEQKNRHYVSW